MHESDDAGRRACSTPTAAARSSRSGSCASTATRRARDDDATRCSTCSTGIGARDDRRRRARARAGHRGLRRARRRLVGRGRDELRALSVVVHDPPPAASRARGRRSRRGRGGRARPPAGSSCSARHPESRLRVGDAVRRADPGRPGARPLPHLRRGDLRPRGRGLPRHRRRAGAAAGRARASTCRRARPLPREHRRARCACSASSGLPARPPRPTTPTAPSPSIRQRRLSCRGSNAAQRSSGTGTSPAAAGTISGETGRVQRAAATRSPIAHRRPGGQDEPRGAARRRARRLPHDVARRASSTATSTPPGHLEVHVHDRHGRGAGRRPPDRRVERDGARRGRRCRTRRCRACAAPTRAARSRRS